MWLLATDPLSSSEWEKMRERESVCVCVNKTYLVGFSFHGQIIWLSEIDTVQGENKKLAY